MTRAEAVEQAMRENALAPWHRELVDTLVRERASRWPRCCQSDCDPCVLTLERAVKRALALLDEP